MTNRELLFDMVDKGWVIVKANPKEFTLVPGGDERNPYWPRFTMRPAVTILLWRNAYRRKEVN